MISQPWAAPSSSVTAATSATAEHRSASTHPLCRLTARTERRIRVAGLMADPPRQYAGDSRCATLSAAEFHDGVGGSSPPSALHRSPPMRGFWANRYDPGHADAADRAELSSLRVVIPSFGKARYRWVPIVRCER